MARASSKSSSKILKSIPASETGKKTICYTKSNQSGDKYIISHNPLKEQFTLWKCVEDGFEKISTSNNPRNFDEKIPYEYENQYAAVME